MWPIATHREGKEEALNTDPDGGGTRLSASGPCVLSVSFIPDLEDVEKEWGTVLSLVISCCLVGGVCRVQSLGSKARGWYWGLRECNKNTVQTWSCSG